MLMEKKCSGEQIVPDICMYVRKVLLLHLRFIVCVRCISICFFFCIFSSVCFNITQPSKHPSLYPSILPIGHDCFVFIYFILFTIHLSLYLPYLPYLHPEGPEVKYEMRIMRNGLWPETDLVF